MTNNFLIAGFQECAQSFSAGWSAFDCPIGFILFDQFFEDLIVELVQQLVVSIRQIFIFTLLLY